MTIRVLYMSTPEFGVPALRLLAKDRRFELVGVVTQPDKPAGRGLKLTPPPIKVEAQRLGVRVLQPLSLRTPEAQATIRALAPDVGAVAAYGQWIPAQVFDLPPKRTLNLHPSLLPRHRGAAPVVSAILAGENEVGLSVLFIEDEMDAGDLLAQTTVPLGPDDTAGSMMAKLAEIGATFFVDTLAAWVAGDIIPRIQDHIRSTWIDRLQKQAGCVDWTLPAGEIARRCRAFSPWPGTFTFFEGRRLLIHRARPLSESGAAPGAAAPGTVFQAGDQVTVTAGEGLLRLDRLQLESRRVLDAADFVRGRPGFVGTKLG